MIRQQLLGHCTHDVKVTRIGDGWNVRCFTNSILNQEIRVYCKEDIGRAAREMLRWEDKCGNWTDQAAAARKRLNLDRNFTGYKKQYLRVI